MKKTILIVGAVLLSITAIVYQLNNQLTKPSPREQLLDSLQKYVQVIDFDFPFIKGLIPELADYKEGTLPLLVDDRFEELTISKRFQIMKDLSSFLPESEQHAFGFSLKKGHQFENVIIQSPTGRYHYSKTAGSLTLPSGTILLAPDYLTIFQIEHLVVYANMLTSEVRVKWGDPTNIQREGDKEIRTYSNGASVTFVNGKSTTIDFKGIVVNHKLKDWITE